MAIKLKWRVGEKPTGRYRSFHKRYWPQAWYGDHLVAALDEVDGDSYDYVISEDATLMVYVFDYRDGAVGRKMHRLKARPVGVKAAKALVQRFFEINSDWLP